MAIESDPTTITVTHEEEVKGDKLHIRRMNIDAPTKAGQTPRASVVTLGFKQDKPEDVPLYGTEEDHFYTRDLFTACANMAAAGFPEPADAVQAIYKAYTKDKGWPGFRKLVRERIAAYTADVDKAQAALAEAQVPMAAAANAFMALPPETSAEDRAAAQANLTALGAAVATAQAAVKAAQDKVTAAKAALQDPANLLPA